MRSLIHGTTLATNALIERKGARTGLLTTAGFRDAVEIGREGRYDMYDLFIDQPAPLVPRHLRLEVTERIMADGGVLTPLDEASARAAIARLKDAGVEAVAICLLHAYRNPVHERALTDLCAELAAAACPSPARPRWCPRSASTSARRPPAPTSTSCRSWPATSTTSSASSRISASPAASTSCCRRAASRRPDTAKRVPIRLVESGPAAGALAAARMARELGEPRLLSFDMGGTTAKACVIDGGEPLLAREFEVARADRFKKGSGTAHPRARASS